MIKEDYFTFTKKGGIRLGFCGDFSDTDMRSMHEIRRFVKSHLNENNENDDNVEEYDDCDIEENNIVCADITSIDKSVDDDPVNYPHHYTNSGIECIDEMILLYGRDDVMTFCKLNAHKYRKRAFDKGGRQDIKKSDWYMAKYAELTGKTDDELSREIRNKYGL